MELLMDAPHTLEASGEVVRVATAGSVDDGKSTLIGRLLYDSKSLLSDHVEAVERTSAGRGDGYLDLSLVTDGLRAEREQGITIDVAYRYFQTPRRSFILADTPGHVEYTRNMVTGASTADVAVILVDARAGVLEHTRRHAAISALLGIRHVVLAVNKMDLVGFDETVFRSIADEFTAWFRKIGPRVEVLAVPISALRGTNVVETGPETRWYGGPTVLEYLESLDVSRDRNHVDLRLPIQLVIRPQDEDHPDYRGYAGRIASGDWRVGDEVVVLPSGRRSSVAGIVINGEDVPAAGPRQSVTIRLADDVDASRGDVIAGGETSPAVVRELDALVCWMGERPLEEGGRYLVKHGARTVRAIVDAVSDRIDVNTLDGDPTVSALAMNDLGHVRFRLGAPLVVDPYARNRVTGAFVVIDDATNDTVGAGLVGAASGPRPSAG